MKKINLLLLCIFLTGAVSAQNSDTIAPKRTKKSFRDGWFNFGPKAGVNVNHLSTRMDGFDNDTYVGFKGGFFARFNIHKFHIQPEVNFSMVGGEGTFNGGSGGRYEVKANTLEIPVLAGYKVLDFKVVNLRLQGGFFFSYNLTKSITVNDPNYPQNNTFRSDKMAGWNGGFIVGGGLDVWRITLDARYQWGLVNMAGDNIFQQDPRAGFKHGTFEITAGFKIF